MNLAAKSRELCVGCAAPETMGPGMNLNDLIERFRGPLVGLLAAWGASPRDAIELAQDVFAEAYVSRQGFRGAWTDLGAVGAWLRGIAHNLFHADLRRGRSGRVISLEAAREAGAAGLESRASETPGAPELLVQEEQAARVRGALDELDGPYRTVLVMRYTEGSSLAVIGALLGMSERAVEGRLRRARLALKEKLERGAVQEDLA